MTQNFLPPHANPIQILAYRTISINSLSSIASGLPPVDVAGDFQFITDPLSDHPGTDLGRKCSLKDVPYQIMAMASERMRDIRKFAGGKDGRVQWYTDERVYVNDGVYTFGMVKVADPGIVFINGGTSEGFGPDGGVVCGRGYSGVHADEDVEMISAAATTITSDQEVPGNAGPIVTHRIDLNGERSGTNGYTRSSSSATKVGTQYTDGAFVHSEVVCQGGQWVKAGALGLIKTEAESEYYEEIPGMYGSYAT